MKSKYTCIHINTFSRFTQFIQSLPSYILPNIATSIHVPTKWTSTVWNKGCAGLWKRLGNGCCCGCGICVNPSIHRMHAYKHIEQIHTYRHCPGYTCNTHFTQKLPQVYMYLPSWIFGTKVALVPAGLGLAMAVAVANKWDMQVLGCTGICTT